MMLQRQQLRTPPNSALSSVRASVGAGAWMAFESAAHAKTSTRGAGAPMKRAGEKRMDRTNDPYAFHFEQIAGSCSLLAYEFAI